MNPATKRGISFGITSGIITTLGVIIGLNSSTGLKLAVIGGILTVAIADAFSDALGMHNSQESVKQNKAKAIWQATTATFLTKLFVALSFLIAVIIFPLDLAVKINIVWGFLLLGIFTYHLAKFRKEKPLTSILKHFLIAGIVIIITYYVGVGIKVWLG